MTSAKHLLPIAAVLAAGVLIIGYSTRNHSIKVIESVSMEGTLDSQKTPDKQYSLLDTDSTLDDVGKAGLVSTTLLLRMERVRDVCRKYSKEISQTITQARKDKYNYNNDWRISYDKTHNLMACAIPKAGSTFLHMLLNKTSQSNGVSEVKRQSVSGFWKYLKPNKKLISFTMTRNPWHRFVSVYIQKIAHPTSTEVRKFVIQCERLIPSVYKTLTFEQLLKCAIEQMKRAYYNRHWEPTYRRCALCNQDYTYVVKQEAMADELEHILEASGIKHATDVMSQVRESTIRTVERERLSSSYRDYYNKLHDKTLMKQFAKFYKIEFDMFGYPNTPFEDG